MLDQDPLSPILIAGGTILHTAVPRPDKRILALPTLEGDYDGPPLTARPPPTPSVTSQYWSTGGREYWSTGGREYCREGVHEGESTGRREYMREGGRTGRREYRREY